MAPANEDFSDSDEMALNGHHPQALIVPRDGASYEELQSVSAVRLCALLLSFL